MLSDINTDSTLSSYKDSLLAMDARSNIHADSTLASYLLVCLSAFSFKKKRVKTVLYGQGSGGGPGPVERDARHGVLAVGGFEKNQVGCCDARARRGRNAYKIARSI